MKGITPRLVVGAINGGGGGKAVSGLFICTHTCIFRNLSSSSMWSGIVTPQTMVWKEIKTISTGFDKPVALFIQRSPDFGAGRF